MLELPEVEELTCGDRFEAMPDERLAVEDHLSRQQDAPGQRNWRRIEQDEIDFVGPQVVRDGSEDPRCDRGRLSAVDENADVDIAERRQAAGGRSTEQVRERNFLEGLEDVREIHEAPADFRG